MTLGQSADSSTSVPGWSRLFSSTGTVRHGRHQLWNRTISFCLARPPTQRMMPGRWDSTARTTSQPQRCTGMARTGRVWQLPTQAKGTNKLNAVLALAPNDVWAVGFSTPVAPPKQVATLTLIEHFDGTSWAVVPSPNVGPNSPNQSNRLLGLTANSANDIWAFGSYFPADGSGHQMTQLLHWDGASWAVASSPSPTKGGFPCDLLWAGVVSSPGDVWILGSVHDGSLAMHMTTGADSSLVSKF
jgi:hypothetical protein